MNTDFEETKNNYNQIKKEIEDFKELNKENVKISGFLSQLIGNFMAFEFNYGLGNKIPNFPEIALICLQIVNESLAKKIIKYGKKRDILRILWERYLSKEEAKFMEDIYLKRNEIEHEGGYLTVNEVFFSIDDKDAVPTLERYYQNTVDLLIKVWPDLKKIFEEQSNG